MCAEGGGFDRPSLSGDEGGTFSGPLTPSLSKGEWRSVSHHAEAVFEEHGAAAFGALFGAGAQEG